MAEEFKRLKRELVYKGAIVDFYKDTIQVPNGNIVKWDFIKHQGCLLYTSSDKGVVIAASWWGKFKTTFQMVMIVLMIADIAALSIVTQIVMWIALILTVVSLVDYLVKNKDVMKDPK